MVKVGAATETEMKERKHRVEDALQATRAALEEGIVPGGGVVLINSIGALDDLKLDGDEATGANIVRRALEEPLRQLAENAGLEGVGGGGRGQVQEGRHRPRRGNRRVRGPGQGRHHRPGHGHPRALQNASSIAKNIITTEAVVADKPEEPGPAGGGMQMSPNMGGMGMGGGMM